MPTISKIRIVNFAYNNGNRLFPDEIIDFEDSDKNALDTYLYLENGGGKSVFVQLVLQNIIPRAVVQGRKIDDFFRRSTDHCFVLIEWHLDTSTDKLMTGIAIAAGLNADEDTEKTARVKFYTFTCQYDNQGDKNDIINMPLSETVNNQFKAASYDNIRSLVKSAKSMRYYSSDDLHRYQSDIEEFGIIRSEWENVIAGINSIEGGIEKFFESYKTSDSLLNNFIIPGIISRDRNNSSNEDGSVETMFRNYAESYAGQSKKIDFVNSIKAFVSELEEIQPNVKQLWEIKDKHDKSVDAVYNFVFSMADIIKRHEAELSEINDKNANLEKEKRTVQLERISNEYYIAEKQCSDSKSEYDTVSEKLTAAKKEYNNAEHMKNVLHAAEKYELLKNAKDTADAIRNQIKAIENNNSGDYAKQLKYSLFIAAEKFYADVTQQLSLTEAEREKLAEEYTALCDKITSAETELSETNKSRDIVDGQKTEKKNTIDSELEDLNIVLEMNMTELYPQQDISAQQKILDKELSDIIDRIEQSEKEKSELKKTSEQLDAEEKNNITTIAELNGKLTDILRRENEYTEKYAAVKKVAEDHMLSENDIFSDLLTIKLKEETADVSDKLKAVSHKIEKAEAQLEAASKGWLHLQGEVIAFLDETGINYQTGEKYLLSQPDNVKSKLLAYPQTAFSVIVEKDSDRKKIFDAVSDDTVLRSVVPLFTYAELKDMLDGKYELSENILSAYSKDYFANNPGFISRLEESINTYTYKINMLNEQLEKLKSDMQTAALFSFDKDYYNHLLKEKSECESIADELALRNKEIKSEKSVIDKKAEALDSYIKKCTEEKFHAENRSNKFNGILEKIATFYDLRDKHKRLCSQSEECTDRLTKMKKTETDISCKIKDCDEKTVLLRKKSDEVNGVLKDVSEHEETELLDKSFESLKNEYSSYLDTLSQSISKLKDKLKESEEKTRKYQEIIDGYEVSENEYSHMEYSIEKYRTESQKSDEYRKLTDDYQKIVWETEKALENAEKIMNSCLKQLNEYGSDLIDKAHIGVNFEERIKKCEAEISRLADCYKNIESELNDCRKAYNKADLYINAHNFNNSTSPLLIECTAESFDDIKDEIDATALTLNRQETEYQNTVHRRLDSFAADNPLFEKTLTGLCSPVNSADISGDKYYTLNENLEKDISTYKDRIRKLEVELSDINNSKNQLVSNCLQRARGIYDGLMMLSKKSKVKLSGGDKKMLNIDLPERNSSADEAARLEMNRHIDEYVKKYLECSNEGSERERENLIKKCVAPRAVLDCFIGNKNIPIKVYKIDSVQSNSGYRTWESTKTDNSGGEKFVVFFSIILSMMNYTRGIVDSLKKASGVLIMDNPFGPISSPHLLKPMFDIAHHFKIQLICLSHIDTSDILSCFNNIYRLKLKQLPLSSREIVKPEPLEGVEHAFYRADQISFY